MYPHRQKLSLTCIKGEKRIVLVLSIAMRATFVVSALDYRFRSCLINLIVFKVILLGVS